MSTDVDKLRRLDLFEVALRGEIEGEIRRDDVTLALYSTDGSMYEIRPLAVCVPRTGRDVARIIEVAASLRLPVLPRGGASSLAGQTVGEAVVIDFTRHLNRVIEIDPGRRIAVVEPGVVLENLNCELAQHGLMVGPDPASANRATLGGMVANNATGTHSILYGNVERHVESVKCVLADGSTATFGPLDASGWAAALRRDGFEGAMYRLLDALLRDRAGVIVRDTPKHWRRNSGYRLETMLDNKRNVARLLCGSEGTLAVITEITIRLVASPKHTAVGVVHFATRDESLLAVTRILETGPSAVELLDGVAIRQCRSVSSFRERMRFVEGDPGAVLIVEYYGDTAAETAEKLDLLESCRAESGLGYSLVRRESPREIDDVWFVRKEALGLVMGVKGDYKPLAFIEDAAVPVEHLASYIRQLDEFIASTGTPVVYYAHASAGTLHVRPFIDTKQAAEIAKMVRISRRSMELVRSLGGSVSSEHGDGLARAWLNRDILGEELYEANRELKRCFDPVGILNPGKVVDAPPMSENLRFGGGYTTRAFDEALDFSADGGFARSVELCTGMGTCRKTTTGTMCPSFMVTFEEVDNTRGRANALRAALSGRMSQDLLFSEDMYGVLDLCIQCKACKTECPSAVDMAALKTEWMYHFRRAHGVRLRDRIFARMPDVGRVTSGRLSALVNSVNRNRAVRFALEKTAGIDRRRPLPTFARRSFVSEFGSDERTASDGRPAAVLFADTFNNYNEPHVARAAYGMLQQAGYEVIVPTRHVCCGRTRFSKGDLDGARSTVRNAVAVLYPFALSGYPIVGLEPSCIHTFGDEGRRILRGDSRVPAVADACVSFERFVAEDRDGLFGALPRRASVRHVLFHGHCHQKSQEGTSHAAAALGLAADEVDVVDSGCCGMAGSFGYEVEHRLVSIAMAERRLAPAVRALPEAAMVVASGSSCRAQIRDVTGRAAIHPAELLARGLLR